MELSLLRKETPRIVEMEPITPSEASAKAQDTADFFAKLDMATVPEVVNAGSKYVTPDANLSWRQQELLLPGRMTPISSTRRRWLLRVGTS